MAKAGTAGRIKTMDAMGSGVGGGSPTGPAMNPPPIAKGGNHTTGYVGPTSNQLTINKSVVRDAPYKTEGKPLGKPAGNLKQGAGICLPEGEVGPEKITGSGDMAPRSYKK